MTAEEMTHYQIMSNNKKLSFLTKKIKFKIKIDEDENFVAF
jgi:hypothetical protein